MVRNSVDHGREHMTSDKRKELSFDRWIIIKCLDAGSFLSVQNWKAAETETEMTSGLTEIIIIFLLLYNSYTKHRSFEIQSNFSCDLNLFLMLLVSIIVNLHTTIQFNNNSSKEVTFLENTSRTAYIIDISTIKNLLTISYFSSTLLLSQNERTRSPFEVLNPLTIPLWSGRISSLFH